MIAASLVLFALLAGIIGTTWQALLAERARANEATQRQQALADHLFEKSGTWLSYGSVKLGQGREKARLFLIDNPDIAQELETKIIAHHNENPGAFGGAGGED